MIITIRLFSSLRESLGDSEFTLEFEEAEMSIKSLKTALFARGEDWKRELTQSNLVHAVNHKVVMIDAVVGDGDEVAFFPPMTGG